MTTIAFEAKLLILPSQHSRFAPIKATDFVGGVWLGTMQFQEELRRNEKFQQIDSIEKSVTDDEAPSKLHSEDLKSTENLLEPSDVIPILTRKKFQEVLQTAMQHIEDPLTAVDLDKMKSYEETLTPPDEENYGADPSKLPGLLEYQALRSGGFAREDIEMLASAAQNGALKTKLEEAIRIENARIRLMLAQPEIEERLQEIETEMRTFYEENGIPFPREALAKISFSGKFQRLVIQSHRSDSFYAAHYEAGQYYPDVDGIIINLGQEQENEFDDVVFSTYAHENFHSLSFTELEEGEQARTLDVMSFKKMRVGFCVLENGAARLLSLNEGATELFARLIGKKLSISPREGHEYDGYVNALTAILENNDDQSHSQITLQRLLQEYGLKSGIDSVKAALEDEIGPHALILFDMLSGAGASFLKFLEANKSYKTTGKIRESVRIYLTSIERYSLDPLRQD